MDRQRARVHRSKISLVDRLDGSDMTVKTVERTTGERLTLLGLPAVMLFIENS